VRHEDLKGRILTIGGGSPPALKRIQNELIQDPAIQYFNSPDHDTSLTYVAAGQAVVLSPGFLNDHNSMYAWIPFAPDITLPCVLCTHAGDTRRSVKRFAELLIEYYRQDGLML
jgi:DNA-binding transcriptional LysR family regulator